MIWLILSIVCSTVIVFVLRLFPKHNVHTFQAIVFNYVVCISIGLAIQNHNGQTIQFESSWLPFSLLLGVIFITLFFIIAKTAQISGVTIATIAMKLGMVAPVIIGIVVYNENSSALKITGVVMAIAAVILTSWKHETVHADESKHSKVYAFLPLVVFLGSGISDSVVQYVELTHFANGGFESFINILFGTAGGIGLLMLAIQVIRGKIKLTLKNIAAGILLGVPNYGSIYFLFKTLNESQLESSVIFPINNIGIVSVAAIGAFIIFHERLNLFNYLGLLATIVSILIISQA